MFILLYFSVALFALKIGGVLAINWAGVFLPLAADGIIGIVSALWEDRKKRRLVNAMDVKVQALKEDLTALLGRAEIRDALLSASEMGRVRGGGGPSSDDEPTIPGRVVPEGIGTSPSRPTRPNVGT